MKLYIPSINQLSYRKSLLEDPVTMSYNKDFDMSFDGYHPSTGCIDFPESKWASWGNLWLDNKPKRFYAYLEQEGKLVGEVALRYIEDKDAYMISIIIDGNHRGKGYGREGLKLLLKVGFKDLNAKLLIDEFEEGRNHSHNLFTSLGFESKKENGLMIYSLDRLSYFEQVKENE